MHEYLFDAKLFASVRVKAENEADARRKLRGMLECAGVTVRDENNVAVYFEVSLDDNETENAELIEVDEVEV
jgi:hypothetical protein